MISFNSLVFGIVMVAGGYLAANMIRGFIEFIMEVVNRQDRDNE